MSTLTRSYSWRRLPSRKMQKTKVPENEISGTYEIELLKDCFADLMGTAILGNCVLEREVLVAVRVHEEEVDPDPSLGLGVGYLEEEPFGYTDPDNKDQQREEVESADQEQVVPDQTVPVGCEGLCDFRRLFHFDYIGLHYRLLRNNYYMAYIKSVQFDDLKLRLKDGQLTDKTNKVLTITANEQCFKTRTASITLNSNTLCWKEKLIVKVANEKQLTFELTDRYQFGYDPDRLVRVLQGTMRVYTDREKQRSWEVFDEKQTRVGTLSATVVDQFHADNPHATVMLVPPLSQAEARQEAPIQASHRKEDPEVRTLPMNRPSRHFLTIFSIISNLKKDVVGMEGAYALIKAGQNKSIKTSHSKGSSTQHAWVDTLKLILPPEVEHVEFTLVGFEGIEQHILCVGELSLQQFERKKRIVSQRIEMMDSGGVAGEIFVDVRCTTELEHERGRDAILRNSRLYASIDVTSQTKRSREKTSLVALTPRSGVHTQEIDQMSPTKPSVVLANNSIVFSKERRFQSYRDKQSPIVSYLKNDLQSTHSSHYRGAHIGYGSKEDFTRSSRYTPGVGEYHLPSIFDRY